MSAIFGAPLVYINVELPGLHHPEGLLQSSVILSESTLFKKFPMVFAARITRGTTLRRNMVSDPATGTFISLRQAFTFRLHPSAQPSTIS